MNLAALCLGGAASAVWLSMTSIARDHFDELMVLAMGRVLLKLEYAAKK